MKKRILFMALVIFLVAISISVAYAKEEEKVYGYGYAFSNKYKTLYITNIVTAVRNSDEYGGANDNNLQVQWMSKFDTIVEKSYEYESPNNEIFASFGVFGFNADYDIVDDARTKEIGEYKQKGFSINYVNDFYFKQPKRKK